MNWNLLHPIDNVLVLVLYVCNFNITPERNRCQDAVWNKRWSNFVD